MSTTYPETEQDILWCKTYRRTSANISSSAIKNQYFLTMQDTKESLRKNNQWQGLSLILWEKKKDIPAEKNFKKVLL